MNNITFCRCDGGIKGTLCKKRIEKACKSFFECGVENIQDCCNATRLRLLRKWQGRDLNSYMLEETLTETKYSDAIKEASLPFKLYQPEMIEIYVIEGEKSKKNEARPMETFTDERNKRAEIYVYLDRITIDYTDIEKITYHELLHACGESQWDGIVRYNLIGVNCVEELLQHVFSENGGTKQITNNKDIQ